MKNFQMTAKHLSQIPALQLLMGLGFEFLTPAEARRERQGRASNDNGEREFEKLAAVVSQPLAEDVVAKISSAFDVKPEAFTGIRLVTEYAVKKYQDESADIFILADKSQRTQFGSFFAWMRQMFPCVCYFGFAGTTLLKKEKTTSSNSVNWWRVVVFADG